MVYSGGLNLGKVGRKIRSACKADDDVDSIESPEEDNAADGDEFCVKNFPNSNRMSISLSLPKTRFPIIDLPPYPRSGALAKKGRCKPKSKVPQIAFFASE